MSRTTPNSDHGAFVPWHPPRLVPGPGTPMQGPGSRFSAGTLVEAGGPLRLLQLADRSR